MKDFLLRFKGKKDMCTPQIKLGKEFWEDGNFGGNKFWFLENLHIKTEWATREQTPNPQVIQISTKLCLTKSPHQPQNTKGLNKSPTVHSLTFYQCLGERRQREARRDLRPKQQNSQYLLETTDRQFVLNESLNYFKSR